MLWAAGRGAWVLRGDGVNETGQQPLQDEALCEAIQTAVREQLDEQLVA